MATMGNRQETPVPTRPSNKSVLDQCALWGWTIRAHHSDWVELEHPDREQRIRVRPASHRDYGSRDVLAQVYKTTCGGNAAAFWGRTEPYHARTRPRPGSGGMTDEQMEEYAARMREQKPQETIIDRLDRAAGLRVVPDPPDELAVDTEANPVGLRIETPEPPRQTVRSRADNSYRIGSEPRPRTIEHDVLQVLRAMAPHVKAVTIDMVRAAIPDLSRQQVANTCTRLADRGLVEYAGNRKGYLVISKTPEQAPPIAAPTQAPPSPAPAAAAPTSPHGDTVDAVMDLMFPDGVKTKYMPALTRWREETIRMMTEVLDG